LVLGSIFLAVVLLTIKWWKFMSFRIKTEVCLSSSVTMLTDIWWSVGYTENLVCVSNSYRNYWLHRQSNFSTQFLIVHVTIRSRAPNWSYVGSVSYQMQICSSDYISIFFAWWGISTILQTANKYIRTSSTCQFKCILK
jgi:hypothetical protein